MKIVAVVPIKMNNSRLPGKNTKLLNGKPLIQYILETLKKVEGIDDIYVYCSNEAIKDYLIDGIKFLKRSPQLDLDTTKINEVLQSFAEDIPADYYLLTHATAPYISADSMQFAIDSVKSGEYDSAFAVERMQDFVWFGGKPLNYTLDSIPRTQDLPPVYSETSGFYLYSRELILNENRRIGNNPKFVEVSGDEIIDIDEEADFIMAELIGKMHKWGGVTLNSKKWRSFAHSMRSIWPAEVCA